MPPNARRLRTRLAALLVAGVLGPGCAKTVCEVLLDEQTQNGCAPQGGGGGAAPAGCQGDVEKQAKCRLDNTDDACRPNGAEQAEIDACVAE